MDSERRDDQPARFAQATGFSPNDADGELTEEVFFAGMASIHNRWLARWGVQGAPSDVLAQAAENGMGC